jgi:hypothetical protein
MIVLCIILFVIAVELGWALIVLIKKTTPPKVVKPIGSDDTLFFEDIPQRLRITRASREKIKDRIKNSAKKIPLQKKTPVVKKRKVTNYTYKVKFGALKDSKGKGKK